MAALITKTEKKQIAILGGVDALIGAVTFSLGIYMRLKVTTKGSWQGEWIPQFTNGFFGVISGFSLYVFGTLGYGLLHSRNFCLVSFYAFLSLACDVLCILDVLMVLPYTKWYGDLAWNDQTTEITQMCKANVTILHEKTLGNATASLHGINVKEFCDSSETIGILFICITTAVLICFLLSTVTTVMTCMALCGARAISASDQPGVPLAPFSTADKFEPTSYNNILCQSDGLRN